MGTGNGFTGAENHLAVFVADDGVILCHQGGKAETHTEIPVVLQLARGVIGRGQIRHGLGVVAQGFPGGADEIVAQKRPEARPQKENAQQHQTGNQAEEPAKGRLHGVLASNL